jgi:uncharacterized caspase-like protein
MKTPAPFLTLLVCCTLLAGCASKPAAVPARLALVIGNAAYEGAPPLKNPVNDANDMCAALRRLAFEAMCHTDVRDRAAFESLVQAFLARLGPKTVGLVYFSGHGVQAGGANFLVPTQVQPQATAAQTLRGLYGVEGLLEQFGQRPAQLRLVVLDACRTDLFAGAQAGTGRNATLARALDRLPNTGQALAPIRHTAPDTFIFYATGSGDVAFDGEGRNGPLTKHVLAHLFTPGQPIGTFFNAVIGGVQNDTVRTYKQRQTPFIYGSYAGRFCFAGCERDIEGPR